MVKEQYICNYTHFTNQNSSLSTNNITLTTNKFYNKKITHPIPKHQFRKGSKCAFAKTTKTEFKRKAKHESEMRQLKIFGGNKI